MPDQLVSISLQKNCQEIVSDQVSGIIITQNSYPVYCKYLLLMPSAQPIFFPDKNINFDGEKYIFTSKNQFFTGEKKIVEQMAWA